MASTPFLSNPECKKVKASERNGPQGKKARKRRDRERKWRVEGGWMAKKIIYFLAPPGQWPICDTEGGGGGRKT